MQSIIQIDKMKGAVKHIGDKLTRSETSPTIEALLVQNPEYAAKFKALAESYIRDEISQEELKTQLRGIGFDTTGLLFEDTGAFGGNKLTPYLHDLLYKIKQTDNLRASTGVVASRVEDVISLDHQRNLGFRMAVYRDLINVAMQERINLKKLKQTLQDKLSYQNEDWKTLGQAVSGLKEELKRMETKDRFRAMVDDALQPQKNTMRAQIRRDSPAPPSPKRRGNKVFTKHPRHGSTPPPKR